MKTENILGSRMKSRRKVLKINQEELAQRLNVARQTVSSWERGMFLPNQDKLLDIAKMLETSVSFLVGETNEQTMQEMQSDSADPITKIKTIKQMRPATLEDFARTRNASRNLDALNERDLNAAVEMLLASLEAITKEQALRTAKTDGIAKFA